MLRQKHGRKSNGAQSLRVKSFYSGNVVGHIRANSSQTGKLYYSVLLERAPRGFDISLSTKTFFLDDVFDVLEVSTQMMDFIQTAGRK